MGKHVGSIMNNCILYEIWLFHCSSQHDLVIITALDVDATCPSKGYPVYFQFCAAFFG